MVLDELHVFQWNPDPIGQGHAVAGLDRAVGRKRKNAPRPARTENDGPGHDRANLTGPQLDRGHALASAVINKQLRRKPLVVERDPVVLERGLVERVKHMKAGLVGCKPRALSHHPAEGTHRNVSIGVAAPGAAPVLQLDQLLRRFGDELLHRVLVSHPVRPADGVVGVLVEAVVVLYDRRSTTFCGHRMTPHRVHLGDESHRQPLIDLGDGDGRPQPRTAAADDHDVMLDGVRHFWSPATVQAPIEDAQRVTQALVGCHPIHRPFQAPRVHL